MRKIQEVDMATYTITVNERTKAGKSLVNYLKSLGVIEEPNDETLQAMKDIPVRMISYGGSNYNISFLVRREDKVKALRSLSQHLFENQ